MQALIQSGVDRCPNRSNHETTLGEIVSVPVKLSLHKTTTTKRCPQTSHNSIRPIEISVNGKTRVDSKHLEHYDMDLDINRWTGSLETLKIRVQFWWRNQCASRLFLSPKNAASVHWLHVTIIAAWISSHEWRNVHKHETLKIESAHTYNVKRWRRTPAAATQSVGLEGENRIKEQHPQA